MKIFYHLIFYGMPPTAWVLVLVSSFSVFSLTLDSAHVCQVIFGLTIFHSGNTCRRNFKMFDRMRAVGWIEKKKLLWYNGYLWRYLWRWFLIQWIIILENLIHWAAAATPPPIMWFLFIFPQLVIPGQFRWSCYTWWVISAVHLIGCAFKSTGGGTTPCHISLLYRTVFSAFWFLFPHLVMPSPSPPCPGPCTTVRRRSPQRGAGEDPPEHIVLHGVFAPAEPRPRAAQGRQLVLSGPGQLPQVPAGCLTPGLASTAEMKDSHFPDALLSSPTASCADFCGAIAVTYAQEPGEHSSLCFRERMGGRGRRVYETELCYCCICRHF